MSMVPSVMKSMGLLTALAWIGLAPTFSDGSVGSAPRQVSKGGNEKAIYKKVSPSVFRIEAGESVGTGFLFLRNDIVATCYHVIENASHIEVLGSGGAKWNVIAVQVLPKSDVALLTLDRPSTRPILLPSNTPPEVGQAVSVIGNALGFLTNSMSTGIVSGRRSSNSIQLLQFTAPISPGSSGSPVLNAGGMIVGMVSFTFSEGQALNLAISADEIVRAIDAPAVAPTAKATPNKEPASKITHLALFKPAADLANELARLKIMIQEMDPAAREAQDAADRFQTFWNRFQESDEGGSFLRSPQLTGFQEDVDSYLTLLKRLVGTMFERVGLPNPSDAESRKRFFDAVTNLRSRESDVAAASIQLYSHTFWYSLLVRENQMLNPWAYFYFNGTNVFTGDLGATRYSRPIPDPAWPRKCVLAMRLWPPGGDQAQVAYHEAEEARVNQGLRSQSPDFEESRNAVAIANAGWTVFAVRGTAGEWQDVTDWRDFSEKARRIRGKSISRAAQLLVGADRKTAKAIDAWLGLPPN